MDAINKMNKMARQYNKKRFSVLSESLLDSVDVDEVADDDFVSSVRNYDLALCVSMCFVINGKESRYDVYKRVVNSNTFRRVVDIVDYSTCFYECELIGVVHMRGFDKDTMLLVDIIENGKFDKIDGIRLYFKEQNDCLGVEEFMVVFGIKRSTMDVREANQFVWKLFSIKEGKLKTRCIFEISAVMDFDNKGQTLSFGYDERLKECDVLGFYSSLVGHKIEMRELFKLLTLETNNRILAAIEMEDKDKKCVGISEYVHSYPIDVVNFVGYYNYVKNNQVMFKNIWFWNVERFSNGIGVVQRVSDYKYLYVDTNGKPVVNVAFSFADSFMGGEYATICRKKEPSYNIINKNFKLICKEWYDWLEMCEVRALGSNCNYVQVRKSDKYNYIDSDGNEVSDEWFDSVANSFKADEYVCIPLIKGGFKAKLFNLKLGFVSDLWFDSILYIDSGGYREKKDEIFVVCIDDKYNIMDNNGKLKYEEWTDSDEHINKLLYYKCIKVF